MQVTIDLPEELALRVNRRQHNLPQILEIGLRELDAANQSGYSGLAQVLEFLAELPPPQVVMALRPSAALQTRISDLLEKNRTCGLTTEEQEEWGGYEYLTHLVRMAKARAAVRK